tara:strand:+ start:243 stop:380 length:138 start_codon:yes stop_codon:yes gene_type:complete
LDIPKRDEIPVLKVVLGSILKRQVIKLAIKTKIISAGINRLILLS